MAKKRRHKRLRRLLLVLAVEGGILLIVLLIYFPGRQTPMALTLATGLGVSRLQARVDRLGEKAINGKTGTGYLFRVAFPSPPKTMG